MSNYLERNAALVAEINDEVQNGLPLVKKWVDTSISGTNFYSLGSYDSRTANRKIFLGYKENAKTDPDVAAFMTLAIMHAVINAVPEYEEEFPILTGLHSTYEEGDKGVIVEDVSGGGQKEVWQLPHWSTRETEDLPEKLLLVNPNLDDEDLSVASFIVGNRGEGQKRMMLDILGLRKGLTTTLFETFPFLEIQEHGREHTVFSAKKF
ncbi:hypothetical protein BH09PAT1_BH09PAT1_3770 [soil metagenome]